MRSSSPPSWRVVNAELKHDAMSWESSQGKGAQQCFLESARVHGGKTQDTHTQNTHKEYIAEREILSLQQLVALCKIPSPQKYHLDDKKLNLAKYRVTNTMRGGSTPSCLELIQLAFRSF